jgi:hypothetical protein
MGTTEESIVYQLLSAVRASELSNDEVITERRIRSYLRTHRANLISKSTLEGRLIGDDCFQSVPLSFSRLNKLEWISVVPSIIGLYDNFGMKLTSPGFENITILSEEDYHLNKKNPVNKFLASAKVFNSVLTIRVPDPSPYAMNGGNSNKTMLSCLVNNKDKIMMSAVLDNPDDAIDYDWTKDAYPCPPELIQEIKNEVLKREFNIILSTKPDQVPNAKNDNLRYHDQGQVQQ